jgi:hypothetical protein
MPWKTHIVHPPSNSKLPNPNADNTTPNSGKQHGEVSAVINKPAVPSLSRVTLISSKIVHVKRGLYFLCIRGSSGQELIVKEPLDS